MNNMNTKHLGWIACGIIGGSLLILLALVTSNTFNLPSAFTSTSSFQSAIAPMMGYSTDSEKMMYAEDEFALRELDRGLIPPEFEPTAGLTAAEVDQKIIKTGYLDLEVEDVSETSGKMSTLASSKGGFVQDSSVSEREDGTHYGSLTVRVPSAEFETTITEIKSYALVVTTESAQGQDVTEQFTDLEAQLRNAKAQEAEFLKILTRATTVEEILQVQSYLSTVRYTIESLEGRLQYIENRTSYSTISIELSEEPTIRIPTKDFRFGTIVREAGQALIAIGQLLATSLVWFVIVGGGILVPIGLFIWVAVKIIRSVRNRNRNNLK